VRIRDLFRHGWRPPAGYRHRVWHARRNNEMIAGVVLKTVLRQPWRLVFTSAAQRKHSALTRFLLRRMDQVIATSAAAASYLTVPHRVIHHGVDTRRFQPVADKRAAWAETGLPGTRGVGVFGRVRANKGTDLFVDAMIRLLPRYPDTTAVVTGLIAPEEAAFEARLRQAIAAAGLENRIFILGDQPTDAMPGWFAAISLYVAPQRWEGFGLTPLEAMASGTAVVATRTGAAPLLVGDGETGLLVPPGDSDALTAAIDALLGDPDRLARMADAGLAKAHRDHDIAGEIRAIGEVYAAALAGS
jgi:mannosyltransferase